MQNKTSLLRAKDRTGMAQRPDVTEAAFWSRKTDRYVLRFCRETANKMHTCGWMGR